MVKSRRMAMTILLAAMVGSACTAAAPGASPSPPSDASAQGNASAPKQRKAISIAMQAEASALATGIGQVGPNSLPSQYFLPFVNAYLSMHDERDDARPWVGVELPSVD